MTRRAGHPAERDLSGYLDAALPPDQVTGLEAHLENCPGCRDHLADLRSAKSALSVLREAEPPAAWLPALRGRLSGDEAHALRRSYRTQHVLRRRLGVVVVASGVLGVGLWIAPPPPPPVSFQQEVQQHMVQIDEPMADQTSYVVDASAP